MWQDRPGVLAGYVLLILLDKWAFDLILARYFESLSLRHI